MMKLSHETLQSISPSNVIVPDEKIFGLPEKVLQFGAGVLLRALPDFFVDKANRSGIFNGRIVIIKTTSRGDSTAFEKQDNLYTVCERGIVEGQKIETNSINSSISRVLLAQNDWKEILECAHNPDLKIIISNTTEVGIQLTDDDINSEPPSSFPGKLLAILHERYLAFAGSIDSGFVIVPTELILDNGRKLKSIVLELAQLNSVKVDFIEWIEKYNHFCNSLVDRIVTGMPDEKIRRSIENELGYEDDLLTVSEVYSLWAIEGDEKIKSVLSFAEVDNGVIIDPNIELHRELKLRLLNGTHTLTCGLAFLAGYNTVRESMNDKTCSSFIANLMKSEIAPSILPDVEDPIKNDFIHKVLDRFRNPHINHYWKNITLHYSSKLRMRCLPLLISYYKYYEKTPLLFALGFAAYIYFMKPVKQEGKAFYGEWNGEFYLIDDEMAERFYKLWNTLSAEEVVKEVLKDEVFWGTDLSKFPGFQQTVTDNLNKIISQGMKSTLEQAFR